MGRSAPDLGLEEGGLQGFWSRPESGGGGSGGSAPDLGMLCVYGEPGFPWYVISGENLGAVV